MTEELIQRTLQKVEEREKGTIPGQETRVVSVDVLKGVSIFLVILAHMANINLVVEEKWLFYVVYTFLDVFGPSMFVFLSSLGVVFSFKKRKGNVDEKKARKAVFQRAGIIFVMGCIPNLILNARFGPLAFWYWFILQFMAVSQVLTYYAMKMPKLTRMILASLILFVITPQYFNFLVAEMANAGIDYTILGPQDLTHPAAFWYWIFFYPPYQTPLLPWIAVPLIASIVGESLVKTMKRGTLEAKNEFRKSMFVDGVIFVLIAALFGSGLTTVDYGFGLITGINGSPFIQVTGLPEFLIPHSNLNVLYSIGMAMILLSIAFTIVDIHNANGRITKFLNFYGRFSLSLFAFHLLVGTWFGNMFTVPLLVIYVVCVWAGLYYFLKMLVLKYKGIGTLEWITARGRSFYETQVKFWREQFQKIKKLFHPVPEYPVENTLEAFIYDALGGMDHMDYGSPPPKPATRRGRRGKKEEKTEIVLEHN